MLPAGIGAGAVLLAVALWAAGGFAETPKQPAAAAGRPVNQGRYQVTVQGARLETVKGVAGRPGERYIVVRMRVVLKGDETSSLTYGGLREGVAARTRAGTWLSPDEVRGFAAGAKTGSVQPGLPVDAAAMWRAGPADAPQRFTVGLRKWEYGPGFTDASYQWRAGKEDGDAMAGVLTLPVAR
ncbi:hypothetical protein ACRB68_25140 [Actinomadura sp. RB68]|uniref:Uncharacterized protein n=1 Tax=Actinomadura macrotermitis TaxID=2585200 RepID=A0A7K0BTE4_9ACTN|nr:hypothetical protein [Actinomadura macrotermitis]